MISIQGILSKFNHAIEGIRSVDKTVSDIVVVNRFVILELNQTQLLSGRNSEGNLLTPGYLSDPYFETPEAAARYANFKRDMQGFHDSLIEQQGIYPQKPVDTPNLIITGVFQDDMYINAGNGTYTIDSHYRKTKDIESKYGFLVFGLAPPSRLWFYQYYLRNAILNSLYG